MAGLSACEVSPEVIDACRSGNRDAFRALYDAYKDRVYSISLYFLHGDQAAACDVTQDVFLKMIASIRDFRGDAEFSTWLYRLVVNACTDAARKRKTLVLTGPLNLEALAAPASQEEDYKREQRANFVRAAVLELPPKFRMAVLLRYFDELSYGQMAKALRCSTGTVASRLSRGHKLLAERLKGRLGG